MGFFHNSSICSNVQTSNSTFLPHPWPIAFHSIPVYHPPFPLVTHPCSSPSIPTVPLSSHHSSHFSSEHDTLPFVGLMQNLLSPMALIIQSAAEHDKSIIAGLEARQENSNQASFKWVNFILLKKGSIHHCPNPAPFLPITLHPCPSLPSLIGRFPSLSHPCPITGNLIFI